MENDKLRKMESILSNYNDIDCIIDSLETEKKILLECNSFGFTSSDLQRIKTSKTNKKNDSLEKSVINFLERIKEIDENIMSEKIKKEKINIAINNLSPIKKDIIEKGYILNYTWSFIGQKHFITQRTLRKYKKEALESLCRSYFY